MSPALRRAAGAVAALGLGTLGWSLAEARAYALRRIDLPLLPPGSAPVRVLHLSDLHLTPYDRDRARWVRGLAELSPALIVSTGDHIAHREALPALREALEPFLALPGAVVTGSNDYYAPVMKNPLRYLRSNSSPIPSHRKSPLPTGELLDLLTSGGWSHLDNARAEVDLAGLRIELVGTGDAHVDADRFPAATGTPADLRLGVTHAPYRRVLERMRLDGVSLTFAGHTHGGQVCLPWFGALVTNCDLDRRMAKGLHRWPHGGARSGDEAMWLHVSAGLGTSPYTPIRLACRPEATLLTLIPG